MKSYLDTNTIALFIIVYLLSIWPALYNGYPLLFYDSTQYLWFSFDPLRAKVSHVHYNAYYPLLLTFSIFFRTLWAAVIIQSIIAIFVIYEFIRVFAPTMQTVHKMALLAGIFIITQVSWLTSWIMCDIFAGLGMLSIYILIFYKEQISIAKFTLLSIILIYASLMSTGNLLPYVFACIFMYLYCLKFLRPIAARAYYLGLILFISTLLAIFANVMLYGRITTNVGSSALIFSRLAEEGIAQEVVKENCKRDAYQICNFMDELYGLEGKGQAFLWGETSLANRTGAWLDANREFARLNMAIFLTEAHDVAKSIAGSAGALLTLSSLGERPLDGNWMSYPSTTWVYRNVHSWFPNESMTFDQSRQQLGEIHIEELNMYYFISQYISYIIILFLFIRLCLARDHLGLILILMATVYIGTSAIVHAGLVGPFVRYQVKSAWILWPLSIVLIYRLFGLRNIVRA